MARTKTGLDSTVFRRARPMGARRGFTLVELLIAVVIVGVLLAIAYPSFLDQVRKSRRADAIAALTAVQQAQERWRSSQTAFTTELTAAPGATPAGLGLPATSSSGYYSISIVSADATSYMVAASAVAGSSQASDGACAVLAVRMIGGNVGYGAGISTSAVDWADPQRCWAR
jgi:type IV pilus assembly protein PilE